MVVYENAAFSVYKCHKSETNSHDVIHSSFKLILSTHTLYLKAVRHRY